MVRYLWNVIVFLSSVTFWVPIFPRRFASLRTNSLIPRDVSLCKNYVANTGSHFTNFPSVTKYDKFRNFLLSPSVGPSSASIVSVLPYSRPRPSHKYFTTFSGFCNLYHVYFKLWFWTLVLGDSPAFHCCCSECTHRTILTRASNDIW